MGLWDSLTSWLWDFGGLLDFRLLDSWSLGFVDFGTFGSSGLWDFESLGIWDFATSGLSDFFTFRLRGFLGISRPFDFGTLGLGKCSHHNLSMLLQCALQF